MSNKTVSCYLMGGLGNQLFQIFTTIAYGFNSHATVLFPYSEVLTTGRARPTYWDTILAQLKSLTTIKPPLHTFVKYNEPSFRYTKIPIFDNKEIMLFGYFQSYLYFEHVHQTIFSMIQLDIQKAAICVEFVNLLNHTPTTTTTPIRNISMHFRLGDYKLYPGCHPIMPFEYYSNALGQILSKHDSRTGFRVLYFCEHEDNECVNSVIRLLSVSYSCIEFMKVDDDIQDWKQLLIMSCCNDNIIANSSFSWWGAYFNSNADKVVCYPKVWFGEQANHNTSDLCPPTWNKIVW